MESIFLLFDNQVVISDMVPDRWRYGDKKVVNGAVQMRLEIHPLIVELEDMHIMMREEGDTPTMYVNKVEDAKKEKSEGGQLIDFAHYKNKKTNLPS
jgi:hypothetical protein